MPKLPPPVEHQFRKGNKGKPKGAINVKTRMIKALLKKAEYLDLSKPKSKRKGRSKITGPIIDLMIEALIKQAIKGNTRAFEILMDRAEGPAKHLDDYSTELELIDNIQIEIIDPNGFLKD